jgi:hypothetical protein
VAFDLPAVADTVTKTVIAVLTLVGVLLIAVGLTRAWIGRRRTQVVIRDVIPVDGIPTSATAVLSPQLRHTVRNALRDEAKTATASVLETLSDDIDVGVLRVRGRARVGTVPHALRSTAEDSLTMLSAGVRALAPKEAPGLVDVLGAALPDQRGWALTAYPTMRGAGPSTQVGLSLEIAQLGRAADAATTIWVDAPEVATGVADADRTARVRSRLNELLEPAALWIAIRLVSRRLRETTSRRPRVRARRQRRDELVGLQRQLAGQMSLYAAQRQDRFARSFTDQALDDLGEAAEALPGYFRPHSTAAAVQERRGWTSLHSNPQAARDAFAAAVRSYDRAEALLRATGSDRPRVAATLHALAVGRTKCRLLTGNRTQIGIGRAEVSAFEGLPGASARALYDTACLFAVAAACPDLPPELRAECEPRAWQYLGLALLVAGPDLLWRSRAITDAELSTLDPAGRAAFLEELERLHPDMSALDESAARGLVATALETTVPEAAPVDRDADRCRTAAATLGEPPVGPLWPA